MRKISRTISGVTPVAAMAKPLGCPGSCVYCPTYPEVPQSYTLASPAVLRARVFDYDPRRQVEERLRVLKEMGHPIDKVELIVMGGTFLAYPDEYQEQFIKGCYDALNGNESSSLEEAKRLNETAKHRCVGLCIETRPDWCTEREIKKMLDFGVTRVELGVQMLDDRIYQLVRRGHTVADVIQATKRLRNNGFKVYYHWMPGLPGSSPEHDLELSRRLFTDDSFRPDGLKLYPTLVVRGTELERWYRNNNYQPYSTEEMINLLINIKTLVPEYVRISRVMRDIPSHFIVAGLEEASLRETLKKRMQKLGIQCRCIRCREYGHRFKEGWRIGEPYLKRLDYQANGGKEIFLSFEDDKETLFALLRLRLGSWDNEAVAIIRELHVFGPEVPFGERQTGTVQHKGLGTILLKEAERIVKQEFLSSRISVLSGVGARDYFSKFGYSLEGAYMLKNLEVLG